MISTIALFVAIGGVGWAAATISTDDIQNGAVTNKKLHKKAVTKAKIKKKAVTRKKIKNEAVNGQKVEDDSLTGDQIDEQTLGEVPSADHANSADRATNANTIAYGMFDANGMSAGEDRVKNLSNANVTHPAVGTYCFEGMSFTPLSAMVSADNGFGFLDTIASVRIATPTGGVLTPCPAAASVRVRTFDVSDAAAADRRFLIWFQD